MESGVYKIFTGMVKYVTKKKITLSWVNNMPLTYTDEVISFQ